MLIENLRGCMNFDGGFGSTPGGESHGGQSGSFLLRSSAIFCCSTIIHWIRMFKISLIGSISITPL